MKILKTAGAAVASVGLVLGMAGFAGATSGTIHNSGDDNDTSVEASNYSASNLNNNNDAGVLNLNGQGGESGNAKVNGNESNGGASTGSVSNSSSSNTSLSVDNGSSAPAFGFGSVNNEGTSADIHNSGDNNNTTVKTTNTTTSNVTNNNNVGVANANVQVGKSGNAKVNGNESNGSATTGSVSNSSNTSTTISIKN